MNQRFRQQLEETPVIAAVKDDESLKVALTADVGIIFILYGDICTIPGIVRKVKASGKMAIVHLDLIAGLSSKNVSVDFLKNNTQADGIISTKAGLIARARELGMATVLRYFILDSMALSGIRKQGSLPMEEQPDLIEFLPGVVLPKVIRKICAMSRVPVSAGGLITDREDVMNALNAGCITISTTAREVWFL